MMKSDTRMLIGLTGLVVIMLFAASAAFAVPTTVNYQGYLTDDSGVPVSGTVSITFRIFDTAVAGTLKWNETQDVDVNNGVYSVQLGSGGSPLGESVFTGEARYLEVEIDGTPLSPRLPFTSNAYAVRAGIADGVTDGAVGTVMVADGAITSAKISAPLTLNGSQSQATIAGSNYGVFGKNTSSGSYGYVGQPSYGMYGFANGGTGVRGDSVTGTGVVGDGGTGTGMYGRAGSYGIYGHADIVNGTGVYGYAFGSDGKGVYGYNTTSGGHAGYFQGNVAADNYEYRGLKTYYKNMPPAAFVQNQASSASNTWSFGSSYAYVSSGTYISAYAPVYLPQGANVTEFRCYYRDSDITYNLNMSAFLRRLNPYDTTSVGMAQVSVSSTGSSTSTFSSFSTAISYPSIDNGTYSYSAYIALSVSTPVSTLQFKGCKIRYTMNTIAP